MKTADRNYLDYFLCMFILHLCPGGFVVKDGKLEFIGVKKSAGELHVNCSAVRSPSTSISCCSAVHSLSTSIS